MEVGIPVPMDNIYKMSVKVTTVVKQVPTYSRNTEDVLPLLKIWLSDHDERYQRKAKKNI